MSLLKEIYINNCNKVNLFDWNYYNLKNKVFKIEEKYYTVIQKFGEDIIEDTDERKLYVFIPYGNILRITDYFPDISHEEFYIYDTSIGKYKMFFDEKPQKMTEVWVGINSYYKYEYNAKKQIIVEDLYSDKKLSSRTIIKYNHENRLVNELIEYDNEGYPSFGLFYDYNRNDNIIKRKHMSSSDGSSLNCNEGVTTYKLNEDGNIIETYHSKHGDNDFYKTKIKYDKNGNKILRYNLRGKEKCNTLKREYTYDNHGNWLTCKEYLDGKYKRLIRREIKYY